MTRLVLIQNLAEAESLKAIVLTHWPKGGKPFPIKVAPQRAHTIALHDDLPVVSIGTETIPEDALPGEDLILRAKAADELAAHLDATNAVNQQLRIDKDALAAEVERLTKAAAAHNPEDASEHDKLVEEHRVLTENHNKLVDEMRAAETELENLRKENAELGAKLEAQKPTEEAPDLSKLTKAELLAIAGDAANDGMTKAQIIEAINAAKG